MKHRINRKITILLALVTILVFISSCGPASSGPGLDVDYRTGTEGLKMEFLENMPTRAVFAGEQFNIGLNMENMGSHDIGAGKITISGYERNQYTFEGGNTKTFQLRGRSQYESKGEVIPLLFNVQSICYPEMAQQLRTNLTTTFRATACYSYATVANAQVCIDTNPLSTQSSQENVCQVSSIQLSGGQGGPVGVTKIEPSMIPIDNGVRARFLIYLKNINRDGVVYSAAAVENNCESFQQQNKILFGASLADVPMYCSPEGEIDLRVGEETLISCEIDLGREGGVYETQIIMGFEYAYSQDVSKKVNVNKPLNVDIPACR